MDRINGKKFIATQAEDNKIWGYDKLIYVDYIEIIHCGSLFSVNVYQLLENILEINFIQFAQYCIHI